MKRRRSGMKFGIWLGAGFLLLFAFALLQGSLPFGGTREEPKAEEPGGSEGPGEEPSPQTPGRWTVVLDPGHQEAEDPGLEPLGPGSSILKKKVSEGTRGTTTGIPEYVYVLELSLLVRDLLEDEGVSVIMTRTTHDVRLGNIDRAKIANAADADLFLRIHANGADNPAIRGISTYTPPEDSPFNPHLAAKSEQAALLLLEEMVRTTGAKDRGNHKSTAYTGINWSKVPVVILETGFMTHPEEDLLLATPAYRNSLAQGIAGGVLRFLEEGEGRGGPAPKEDPTSKPD